MIEEFKTYLSISPNKFEIFLYDTKKLKNFYKENIEFDNQSEEINCIILNKFLEENIFKIEKFSGNFINNICLLIEDKKIQNISLGIKQKNFKKKIEKSHIEKLITDAKDLYSENYIEEKILHVLIKSFIIDGNSFSPVDSNLVGDSVHIEVQFKSVSIKLLKEIENVLEKYHIKVSDKLDQNYLKDLSEDATFELDEIAYKVQNGLNENEVNLVPKNQKKKGFFEKFFQLFS